MPKNKKYITEYTFKELEKGLNIFENKHKFLKREMSLPVLAAELKTNTRYISYVIRVKKKKSFTCYINELRINYISHLLENNKLYRKYKISHLAIICGFSSREVFYTSFKKYKGISPSQFIKKL